MTGRLFGTDGIRGRVNQGAIRPENFVRFGEAIATVFKRKGVKRPSVLIGRDTRQSGYMIESAIVAGLINAGADVETIGVVPTPAIGFLAKEKGYDAGLMITASHNPASDNGVKVFGSDGFKLNSDLQQDIENLIQSDEDCSVEVCEMGGATISPALPESYFQFAKQSVAEGVSFSGLKICVDAANGAGYAIAPGLFADMGADVVSSSVHPNGHNINLDCGALHPEKLQDAVLKAGADIGIALDGDADRILIVDEKGQVIDGDQILGAIGLNYHAAGNLKGGGVVATVMSNLGLEAKLKERGLRLERTKVGDRYVVERMREQGYNVGGEQSGHIVLSDYVTTGDAVLSAIQILAMMIRQGETASELLRVFEPVPQVLKNVRYGEADPLQDDGIKARIDSVIQRLGDQGRLVIRKSGTEPVIRVMAEAFRPEDASKAVDDLVSDISVYVARSA